MNKFMKANKNIEKNVANGYEMIKDNVISGYKTIEDGVVSSYKKIENKFIDEFLAPDHSDSTEKY